MFSEANIDLQNAFLMKEHVPLKLREVLYCFLLLHGFSKSQKLYIA